MANLDVQNISKQFATRGEPLVVLRGTSLELSDGENLAIVGPSGSGKSTLLHIMGTLDQPSAGSVNLNGQDPFVLPEPELARFRNRHIGFIFQEHHLLPQLSVVENVLLPAISEGKATPEDAKRATELIDRVGLSDRSSHRPAELSGGERQRVAVARALLHKPSLLLADEPTGNLDQTNAMSIGKLLLELQAQEQTMMVVVTHSAELARLMQRQLELDNGTLK